MTIESKLIKECQKKRINWDTVEKHITKLGSAINEKTDDCETVLSNLINHCGFGYTAQPLLVPLISLFLKHGYDVHANDNLNGGACLHSLCWSTYTSEIIDAAVLLLDAGADPQWSAEEDEDGVLDSISFKLGYWTVGDLSCANLFEAYYELIEAAMKGKDYHGIHTIAKCQGKAVTKIEQLSFTTEEDEFNQNAGSFMGAMLIWCEDVPLVISDHIEFVVNPLEPLRAIKQKNVTRSFAPIIGKTIAGLLFLSAKIAELIFDDGTTLLFGNNYMGVEKETCFAKVEFRDINESDIPIDEKINRVYFRSGKSYASTCNQYTEDIVFLECDDSIYMFSSLGEDYEKHRLVCRRFSKDWFQGLSRSIKEENFIFVKEYLYQDGSRRGIHYKSKTKHLYLLTTEFSGVKVMLESSTLKDPRSYGEYSDGEHIDFIYR